MRGFLHNTSLQHFTATLFYITSPQHSSPTLFSKTSLQHFSTTLLHNTPSQHSFTRTFRKGSATIPQHEMHKCQNITNSLWFRVCLHDSCLFHDVEIFSEGLVKSMPNCAAILAQSQSENACKKDQNSTAKNPLTLTSTSHQTNPTHELSCWTALSTTWRCAHEKHRPTQSVKSSVKACHWSTICLPHFLIPASLSHLSASEANCKVKPDVFKTCCVPVTSDRLIEHIHQRSSKYAQKTACNFVPRKFKIQNVPHAVPSAPIHISEAELLKASYTPASSTNSLSSRRFWYVNWKASFKSWWDPSANLSSPQFWSLPHVAPSLAHWSATVNHSHTAISRPRRVLSLQPASPAAQPDGFHIQNKLLIHRQVHIDVFVCHCMQTICRVFLPLANPYTLWLHYESKVCWPSNSERHC